MYDELHRIAAPQLRAERAAHTLQPTALVHEAYLKLLGEAQREFADRVQSLAIASRAMRQILVDYARAQAASKRGGEQERLEPEVLPRFEVPSTRKPDRSLLDTGPCPRGPRA